MPSPCCVVVWEKPSRGGRVFGRMSGRKGDDKVSMSNKDSKEENLLAEVTSNREWRRELLAETKIWKDWELQIGRAHV